MRYGCGRTLLVTLWLLKSWTRYCLVDSSSLAGDVKPAPWDFNLETPDEKKSSKGKYTPKDAGGKFSNISPIVCDVYADSMSIPNPNNSGHQYPHPSPLARTLRPIYSTLQSTTSPTAPPISCLFDPQHWHLRSLAQTDLNS